MPPPITVGDAETVQAAFEFVVGVAAGLLTVGTLGGELCGRLRSLEQSVRTHYKSCKGF